MGFFRKPRELPKGVIPSDAHQRPLVLGTKPNRISSAFSLIWKKTKTPRKWIKNPFSPYLAFREYRRKIGETQLLRKAHKKNPELIKKYAPRIEKIRPTLTRPETMPFGKDIITAIEGLEARHERIGTENERKMDAENAFTHQGVTNRITVQEVQLLKKIEANRQDVIAESESIHREIALEALSPNSKKRTERLEEIKKHYDQLFSTTRFVQQSLLANQELYTRLEREYSAMHQRMHGNKADEAAFTSTGKMEDI